MAMSDEILLHDAVSDCWLHFKKAREVIQARGLEDVLPLLRRVEEEVGRGAWAAGFISYEAGPAFDPAFTAHQLVDFPLAWFGIYDAPESFGTLQDLPLRESAFKVGAWTSTVTEAEFARALDCIKDHIAQGNTYQVNYTYRLRAPFTGEPQALFAQLAGAARSSYSALVDTGRFALCSASPELFFTLNDGILTSKPMKGTAARGRTLAEGTISALTAQGSRPLEAVFLEITAGETVGD
jgi:para-aminobenzoate synthetase/4-amino-4-deoxychorismate lyase